MSLCVAGGTHRARRPAALLAILAALLAAGAWLVLRADDPKPLAGAPAVRPAAEFVDSIGVNVHVTYYDTAYARFDEWLARLRELGTRHVRDGLVFGGPQYEERIRRLAAAGQRMSLIVDEEQGTPAASVDLAAGPLREAVETLEGPNEPDDPSKAWEPVLRRFLPDLRRAVDSRFGDSVPLLGPSFVQASSRATMEDMADQWDYENIHPYPGGGPPVPPDRGSGGERPVMATETGYHNAVQATEGQPPVSEEVAGQYVPRLYAEYFESGVTRSFLYELIDEKPDPGLTAAEQHFGLLRNDLTPKPAFHALRNLLTRVSLSPGEGPSRDVETPGADSSLGRLLLERKDGSRILLLWRRVPLWDTERRTPLRQPPSPVGLRFSGEAEDIEVAYPSRSATPVGRPDSSELEVMVGGDVVAVSFR